MIYPLLYRAGYAASILLPRLASDGLAAGLAWLYSGFASRDRLAVRRNLEAVLGPGLVSERQVREVFRNFAIYLVDFFRFGQLTPATLHRWVQLEGEEWMRKALAQGRGVIGLTAHLGNYELAGAVLALMGFPIHAAVFTHQDPQVDAFFSSQRARVGVRGIPVCPVHNQRQFFQAALQVLKSNGILGLVGDRDFFGHGLELPFFGKTLRFPRGPAALSIRTGAPIIPCFLVRESDGRYRYCFEPPVPVPEGLPRQEAIRQVCEGCLQVMGRYIRRYATQWYMFQEFWKLAPPVVI